MNLEQQIREIRSGIEAHRFTHGAAVAQGIVLRLLDALSWPCWDTSVVAPQYSIEGQRADFALCHPANQPVTLIEIKQPGITTPASERQMFGYALRAGVPWVVLTDGQQWEFFLSAEQGGRVHRVYKLDLLHREISECVSRLTQYLQWDAVISGRTVQSAREDKCNAAQTRIVEEALPKAWQKLIEEKDALLVARIADQAANLCGYEPDVETIVSFLQKQVTCDDQPARITSQPIESSSLSKRRPSPQNPSLRLSKPRKG